jgi:hypothetical protein
MTRRELAAVLALLAIVFLLVALWPPSTRSDQPVVSATVPASAFVAIGSAGQGLTSPALPQPRTPSPTLPAAPVASVSPSASMGTPVRSPAHQAATVDRTVLASGSESMTGTASTYGPGFDGYLALPSGPGHKVRICGAGGCVSRVSNDSGPDLAMQRKGRIVDLDVADFEAVCGLPWTRGLCRVSVEAIP